MKNLTKKEAIAYSGVVQVLGLASLLDHIPQGVQHATRACFLLLLMAGRSGSPSGRSYLVESMPILLRPVTKLIGIGGDRFNSITRRQYHA